MSKISVLRSQFDSTHWKLSFATRLSELRPDMNPDAADELSDSEFACFKELDPSLAAERWVDREDGRSSPEDKPAASAG